ncbi:MAG: PQQ-binding-like beta-propeller repeat protein [Armatimonadetes bacterium]|nr:PQQ-binding-like beta-propeller repeat protein [Armatimonadota bacterium]
MNVNALSGWIKTAKATRGGEVGETLEQESRRLRRELAIVTEERDILKKKEGTMIGEKGFSMKNTIGIAGTLVLLTVLMLTGGVVTMAQGQVGSDGGHSTRAWDFAADFSAKQNPNGAWSYGSTSDNGATIDIADKTEVPPTYLKYIMWGAICKNTDMAPLSWGGGPCYWEAGQAGMDPGSKPDSVIRWTSPVDGFVSVSVRFTGQRPSGGTHAAVSVAKNGSKLFGGEVHGFIGRTERGYADRSGAQPEQTFFAVMRVSNGDRIDCMGRCLAMEEYSLSPPLKGGFLGIDAEIATIDPPAAVRGKVRANVAGNHGVAGAIVKVVGTLASTVTDEDGSYTLDLPPDDYALKVEYPGCKTAMQVVKLPSGGAVDQDFALGMGLVTGRVTERGSGRPLGGATVEIAGGIRASTVVDGTYALPLPPGSHEVEVRLLQHNLLRKKVSMEPGKTRRLDMELSPGTLYPWTKYAYDSRNSCVTDSPGPATSNLLWKFSTGTWPALSSPARADGKIIAGASDGDVYALDESTGKKVWSYKTGDEIWSSPAVADGLVYIGSSDGKVYALSLSSGKKVWEFATAGEVRATPAVSDGVVYIASQDGNVYALNAKTGKVAWTHQSETMEFSHLEVWSSATVLGNTVYISSGNGNVYALDAGTGDTLWEASTKAFTFLSTPKVADGRVYVAAHVGWELNGVVMGLVYGFDAATGKQLWTYQTGAWLYSDPVVANGKVYVACGDTWIYSIDGATGKLAKKYFAEAEHFNSPGVDNGVIYISTSYWHILAIDEATGEHLWRKVKDPCVSSAPLIADGRMYMTSSDSHILALDTKTGKEVWSYKTDGWIFAYPGVFSSPAVVDGKVYVGSSDARLYALEATTGKKLWAYKSGGAISSSPAVSNGIVYAVAMDGKVHAVDAASGKQIWATKICSKLWVYDIPTLITEMWSSPCVVNGKLYVGSGDGGVYALDAYTGEIIWRVETQAAVCSSPAVVDGVLYIGSANNGNVYALDADTGAEVWRCNVGAGVFGSVAYAYGNVYVSCHDGKLYGINADTGSIAWRFNCQMFATPSVCDGVVYAGSAGGGVLLAFDAFTGREIWRASTMSAFWSCPAISGGNIYIGCCDSHLYCFDRKTGKMLWKYRTGHEVLSTPAVADGVAYVGSCDGNVYAIGDVPQ